MNEHLLLRRAVSRNRYWGTPLPVWISEDGTEKVCIKSVEHLAELSGVKVTDLHRETYVCSLTSRRAVCYFFATYSVNVLSPRSYRTNDPIDKGRLPL